MYDVVIVGGGVAGLSAALLLGRGRRKVLVFDGGAPRNAPAEEAHSFFTRDGTPPLELLRIGRAQAEGYGVEIRSGRVVDVAGEEGAFAVTAEDGTEVAARRLLLATGVVDDLPEIEGLRERWGRSVFHCPYCHGWEVRDRPLAVLARGDEAMELVKLLRGWSRDLVLCTHGPAELSDEARAKLARHGVPVREEPVVRLEGGEEGGEEGGLERIVFASGDPLPRAGILLRPPQRPASDLAGRLGCEHLPGGGPVVDVFRQTTVPGVYAAGDLNRGFQSVSAASAEGAMAAAGINHALLAEEFG